jgi:hypothetical protein
LDIDPEEMRSGYAEMSDEGILALDRKDLTDLAQRYYDQEITRRGLHPEEKQPAPAPEPNSQEELVTIDTYLSIEEADMARTLLQSADIPTFLDSELSMGMSGMGGLRLKVPSSFVKQAEEILETPVSDADLEAQAEAAAPVDPDRKQDQDEGV